MGEGRRQLAGMGNREALRATLGDEGPPRALQNPVELELLLALYVSVAPSRVLEIGTFLGGTLYQWKLLSNPGTLIAAIDLDHVSRREYDRWPGPAIIYPFTGRSQDFAELLASVPHRWDWIYVDGDHEYDAAKQDFELYWPQLRPGGVMVFHDTAVEGDPPGRLVARLWRELKASPPDGCADLFEIVGPPDTNPLGTGVIVKAAA
jgi:predicted O-methyltransferase YrrM